MADITTVEEKHIAPDQMIENTDGDDLAPQSYEKATEFEQHQLKSDLERLTLLQTLKTFRRTAILCAIAAFSASLDGYQYTLSGSIVSNLGFIRQFSGGAKSLPSNWVSTFTGLYNTGQVLGQFSIQWISEWYGRKGAILECTGRVWYVWSIAKLIAGMGVGAVQATLPLYINEQAPVNARGFFTVSYTWWFNIGNLMAAVALQVQSTTNPYNYLNVIYIQFGMIAVSTVIFVLVPESPWWAVRKDKMALARKILKFKNKDVPGFDIEREISIMASTVEEQRLYEIEMKAQGPFAIFKGLNGKRFLIGCWPLVLQLLCGVTVFSTNATYFFQIAGYPKPFQVTVILTCTAMAAITADILLVDKIGRRRICLIGFTGASIGITLISIVGLLDYTSPKMGPVLVFGAVFARFFNNLQNSTVYAFLNEVPDQRLKARSAGWGLAYVNLYGIVINFTLPLMLAKWSVPSAWMFVCLGVPGTVLAYFIMPETMRRSPAEIQEMFVDGVPLRKWRGYKTRVEKDLEVRTGGNPAEI